MTNALVRVFRAFRGAATDPEPIAIAASRRSEFKAMVSGCNEWLADLVKTAAEVKGVIAGRARAALGAPKAGLACRPRA